jgi:TatD DNase family protein
MRLFDTHAHLDNEQIFSQIETVIEHAIHHGVVGITSIGTTVESSRRCIELAERFEPIAAAVGIHPTYCHQVTEREWPLIEEMANHPRVVAIGETGLDRYWDECPIEIQRDWFARHIELSFETDKPLVIHTRDCEFDMLEMLDRHQRDGRIIGIMHSFCGSWEAAQQCLDWGMYLSFAGMLTFKKSDDLRDIAARVPSDRILIETDSPYLTPHPHRGKRPNQPALVRHTAECLADVRGISLDKLGELTTRNARRVFRLDA